MVPDDTTLARELLRMTDAWGIRALASFGSRVFRGILNSALPATAR